jgi:hypothetical protein
MAFFVLIYIERNQIHLRPVMASVPSIPPEKSIHNMLSMGETSILRDHSRNPETLLAALAVE